VLMFRSAQLVEAPPVVMLEVEELERLGRGFQGVLWGQLYTKLARVQGAERLDLLLVGDGQGHGRILPRAGSRRPPRHRRATGCAGAGAVPVQPLQRALLGVKPTAMPHACGKSRLVTVLS
jgi:hypothetical protein